MSAMRVGSAQARAWLVSVAGTAAGTAATMLLAVALAVALAIALAIAPAGAAAAAGARRLAHVEGLVGNLAFDMVEPTATADILAALKDPNAHPPLVDFGPLADGNHVGFTQYIPAPDGSAARVQLRLPAALAAGLKPGTYLLGGTTGSSPEKGSQDGWDGKCPDDETGNGNVIIDHYGVPGANAPRIPGIAGGAMTIEYQTHRTRIRQDSAQLTIKAIDPATRFIEGEASGEVSYIVPKDGDEANSHKDYEWMCMPGEYTVRTETFRIRFQYHLARSWTR